MSRPRPPVATTTDILLSALLDQMEAQGAVLGRILDRLPEPTAAGQPDPVQVSEPAPKRKGEGEGGPVQVTEPAPPATADGQPVDEPAPQPTPQKTTARKATPRGGRRGN